MLEDVQINETDGDLPKTTYRFTGLTRIEQSLPLSTLTLKNTRKSLSDKYIRPYAICFTPAFLLDEHI